MTDTPRCDAATHGIAMMTIEGMVRGWTPADFARSLERELNDCKAHAGDFAADCERLEQELASLRKNIESLEVELFCSRAHCAGLKEDLNAAKAIIAKCPDCPHVADLRLE